MDERIYICMGFEIFFANLQAGDQHRYQFAHTENIIKHNLKNYTVHTRLFLGWMDHIVDSYIILF